MINCLAQELYNTEAYRWIIIITLTSIQVFIEFFHEKEICPPPKVWLGSSIVSSAQLVSGRHGFESRQGLIFLSFFSCNCLNNSSPVGIISVLEKKLFLSRITQCNDSSRAKSWLVIIYVIVLCFVC